MQKPCTQCKCKASLKMLTETPNPNSTGIVIWAMYAFYSSVDENLGLRDRCTESIVIPRLDFPDVHLRSVKLQDFRKNRAFASLSPSQEKCKFGWAWSRHGDFNCCPAKGLACHIASAQSIRNTDIIFHQFGKVVVGLHVHYMWDQIWARVWIGYFGLLILCRPEPLLWHAARWM